MIVYIEKDLDENGPKDIFHLPTGDIELYMTDARILHNSLIALGVEVKWK